MKVLCLILLIADIFLFGGAGYRVLTVSASEVEVARHKMAVNTQNGTGGVQFSFDNFSSSTSAGSVSVEESEEVKAGVTMGTENGRTTFDADVETMEDEAAGQEIQQEGLDDAKAKIRGIGKKK